MKTLFESWLLLIAMGGQSSDLPRFARRDSQSAKRYYHPAAPPPQLKDFCDSDAERGGFASTTEWAFHTVLEKLDAPDLASRSPSFALFKRWLDAWPKPSTGP